MKKSIAHFIFYVLLSHCISAQYTYEQFRTAEQLVEKLKKENVSIINPHLDCRDSANLTFQGEGLFFVDSGIVLSTTNAANIFNNIPISSPYLIPFDSLSDTDLNNIYYSWGVDSTITSYATCKLSFDIIPHTDTIKIDYSFYEAGMRSPDLLMGSYLIRPGCRPVADMFAILVSGGAEAYDKKNFVVIPGTDIPVNLFTLQSAISIDDYPNCRDTTLFNWGDAPYLEYYYYFPDHLDTPSLPSFFKSAAMTVKMEAIIPVTPCDTYAVKIAIAKGVVYFTDEDFPPGTIPPGTFGYDTKLGGSVFFLGNLRGIGTVFECETPAGIEIPKTSQHLQLYPNPARASINIDLSALKFKEGTSLRIYDMLGKLVYTQALSAFSTQLEVHIGDLAPGSYELLIQTDEENYKGRFVKE